MQVPTTTAQAALRGGGGAKTAAIGHIAEKMFQATRSQCATAYLGRTGEMTYAHDL
jgi:hypothetical protein